MDELLEGFAKGITSVILFFAVLFIIGIVVRMLS